MRKRSRVNQQQVQKIQQPPPNLGVITKQSWVGPLPPPACLNQYEDTLPGASERIVALTEREQKHRHEMDKSRVSYDDTMLKGALGERKRGQYFAFAITILISLGGFFLANNGKEISGSILGTGGLVTLVYMFINGKKDK